MDTDGKVTAGKLHAELFKGFGDDDYSVDLWINDALQTHTNQFSFGPWWDSGSGETIIGPTGLTAANLTRADVSAVPEPGSILLLLTLLGAVTGIRQSQESGVSGPRGAEGTVRSGKQLPTQPPRRQRWRGNGLYHATLPYYPATAPVPLAAGSS